jgi:hypothetical protein
VITVFPHREWTQSWTSSCLLASASHAIALPCRPPESIMFPRGMDHSIAQIGEALGEHGNVILAASCQLVEIRVILVFVTSWKNLFPHHYLLRKQQ